MPHYKDPSGSLHFLQDAAFESLLPEGSVPISDEEVQSIRAPTAGELRAKKIADIKSKLNAIDLMRIRPIAEGDSDFLSKLNAQALPLRAELAAL